jgi:DoxX-like family
MSTTETQTTTSRGRIWTGRVLTGLAILFLLFDAAIKFAPIPPVVDAMARLGYPLALAPAIGVLALAGVALHAFPKTAIIGAIFLTAFLGGATASQVRIGEPLFTHILFPSYIAALLWGGLWLRDARMRALVR